MKNKRILYRSILTTILALFIISAGVMALTNPGIPRHFIGAGGQSTGGGYTLTGSIGQHDAGASRPACGSR